MKSVFILLNKELKSLFVGPLFYIIAFLSTILLGTTFSISLLNFAQQITNAMMALQAPQQQNIHFTVFITHYSVLNLLLMFLLPALSMRLIAEEKKNRTYDLLLTSPISSVQIVAAKYLSIAFVVLLLSGLTFFYVLFARKMFSFPVLPELVALGGITFVGLCYGAMSLFASSLTDNPLIAFFVGIFFNIFIWLMGGFAELADSSMLKSIFDQISLNQHTQSLVGESVIRANGIVFYVSLIFLFCFLTERVVESSRWRS